MGEGRCKKVRLVVASTAMQDSCKSPIDACDFGDGCCARRVFAEAAHFSTLVQNCVGEDMINIERVAAVLVRF